MKLERSHELWEEGKKYMPSGVSAGGRVNVACGMPHYIDHAKGARLYTVDDQEFIDYHGGSGASMFGHKHPRIQAALECIEKGFLMNYDTEKTIEFAKNFTKLVPTVEKFRLLNSGTESTMAAIRIARGYTGKDIVIKLDGHFHGMHEMVWYNHNNYPPIVDGVCETVPDSAGIPRAFTDLIKVAESNNLEAVAKLVEKYKGNVAAIIIEPICFNMGCSMMKPEFVRGIREICDAEGICMIMDEVITGLRFRPGSAAGFYGVQPDITTFAKALGGGASISLVGGKAKIMDICSPGGIVGVSGTYSGNQLGVYAANACVSMALEDGFYAASVQDLLSTGAMKIARSTTICAHRRSCSDAIWQTLLLTERSTAACISTPTGTQTSPLTAVSRFSTHSPTPISRLRRWTPLWRI